VGEAQCGGDPQAQRARARFEDACGQLQVTEQQRQAVRARFARDVSTLTNALLFGIRPGPEDKALALDFVNGAIKACGQSDEFAMQFYELAYDMDFSYQDLNS
jgi:hypothetical protein